MSKAEHKERRRSFHSATSSIPIANFEQRLAVAAKEASTTMKKSQLNRNNTLTDSQKTYIVYAMMCLQAFDNLIYVQQTPFVPLLANKAGVNPQHVGYIFGTMAIT